MTKTPEQETATRFAKLPKTLAALEHLHGGQQKYASHVVLYLMAPDSMWPKPKDYGITWEDAKHARRTVTTAFMLDLDWFNGVP